LNESPPKIWIAFIAVPTSVVVVLDLWLSYRLGHYFFLLSVAFWILILLPFVPEMTTKLSQDGIVQITYRGRREIAWNDVIDVKHKGKHLHVSSRHSTIHIWLSLFENPDAAGTFVFSKLPPGSMDR